MEAIRCFEEGCEGRNEIFSSWIWRFSSNCWERLFVTNGGLFLPKGSIAFIPLILLLRNSDIFEDADSFIPPRWDNPTKEIEAGFLPFALGEQNCIGKSLATPEIYSIVPRICAEFELELVDEGEMDYDQGQKTLIAF